MGPGAAIEEACSLGARSRRFSRQTGGVLAQDSTPPRAFALPPCRSRRSESAARCRAALLQSAKAPSAAGFTPAERGGFKGARRSAPLLDDDASALRCWFLLLRALSVRSLRPL